MSPECQAARKHTDEEGPAREEDDHRQSAEDAVNRPHSLRRADIKVDTVLGIVRSGSPAKGATIPPKLLCVRCGC